MIKYIQGDLFRADTEALVNTVNCVGVMGGGIARRFKELYPFMYAEYVKACNADEVEPGKMHVWRNPNSDWPKYVINFPTKKHWRDPSELAWIDTGLVTLVNVIREYDIKSIAIPALGCGLGGLSWDIVKPKIAQAFDALTDVQVLVYEPKDTPHG